MFTVYVHISPTNKLYFGITSRKVTVRWKDGNGYGGCPHFYNAIQKYGWDNFKHIILLENLTKEVACECEKYLINKYNTTNPEYGYNISFGGDIVQLGIKRTPEQIERMRETSRNVDHTNAVLKMAEANRGKKRSQEVRNEISKSISEWHKNPEIKERLSKSLRGRKLSDEHRQKLSDSHMGKVSGMKGKKHTEASRKKMSESQKRAIRVYTEDGLNRIREASRNRVVSDETREKIRQSHLGKIASEETRRKQSLAKKGKPSPRKGVTLSEETKQKIRDGAKKAYKPLTEEQRQKISEASKRRWGKYRLEHKQ